MPVRCVRGGRALWIDLAQGALISSRSDRSRTEDVAALLQYLLRFTFWVNHPTSTGVVQTEQSVRVCTFVCAGLRRGERDALPFGQDLD